MKNKLNLFLNRCLDWCKKHLKLVVLALIIISLICLLLIVLSLIFKSFSNKGTGLYGVVRFDGDRVAVFENIEDAISNRTSSDAETVKITISGKGEVKLSALIGDNKIDILEEKSSKKYNAVFDKIPDKTNVIFKLKVGGDGSWFGERLKGNVDTYYFCIEVNNPNMKSSDSETSILGLPTGKIFFGEDIYDTFASEAEAIMNAKGNDVVLPTYMVNNGITLTAEPSSEAARIWVKVVMIDDSPSVSEQSVRLNQDSGWTGVFDVSKYAGHFVTLMLKSENNTAITSGYQYVGFYVPDFETEDPEYLPPVVNYSE